MPAGETHLQAPPDLPRVLPVNMLTNLLPGVMILTSVGFVAIGGLNPASLMMGGMMVMSTVGMMGAGQGNRRGARKAQLTADRNDYLAYLDQIRDEISRTRSQQRAALVWTHPDPTSLWSIAGGRRMWERRPGDADFSAVRIGTGTQRLARRLIPPQTGPVEEVDPIGVLALRRLVRAHSLVDDLPLAVKLRSFPAVSIGGDPDQARSLARSMVAQLASFHGPDHLLVAAAVDGMARSQWDWLKWLPQNQHPTLTDSLGSARMVTSSLADVEMGLGPELADRPRFNRASTPNGDEPHIVIIVDGGQVTLEERIMLEEGLVGVTLIDLSNSLGRLPARRGLRLLVEGGRVGAIGRDQTEWLGGVDLLTVGEADALARWLAPHRLSTSQAADDAPLTGSAELVDMLGIGNPANIEISRVWRPRSSHERLRIPIGIGEHGEPVDLDIKEAAQGGMGPHGLVIGATGSGKSELLRTLVLGLAVTHPASALNLILVDFKGGATFLGLQDLPHTAAVITNLQDDLTMVDRMYDALSGEMNRRQELLKAAGNFANVKDYERAREQGAPLDPLPSLLIVCDEFSEMLSQKPEFAELFVAIGRLGRSLSMHLLLASQRLEEGKLRGLDSHLSYRIGLKTFSAAESRTVLGVTDAYELPSIPGSGYLKFDTSTLIRFKAAYVSGPYQGEEQAPDAGGASSNARPCSFVSTRVELEELPPAIAPPSAQASPTADEEDFDNRQPAVLDVVVSRLRGQGMAAHEVWLPPLREAPTFDQLLPPLSVVAGRGLCPEGWTGLGGLRVPVGIVDLPFEQRRDLLALDFSGAAGHGVVVGGPQSGKSTLLRDVVTSLALAHTPHEVQIYCIDLGGGSLAATEGLPHVGAVASRSNPDLVRRMIAEVGGILNEREEYFRRSGIESMSAYRQLRREGRGAPGTAGQFGDVFIFIDGWASFRTEFEDLEQRITSLASQGLSFGVHIVISAARWAEIRAALKDMIGTRLELRLGDPGESEVDRRMAQGVPRGTPGRGLTSFKRHFLAALPRIDGAALPATLSAGFSDLVAQVASAWTLAGTGVGAPPVRMLPAVLPYDQLSVPSGSRLIPIGINEEALAPVSLDFDAEPHFLYFADGESGKTNFLKVVASRLMEQHSSSEVRILLADYRRTMLGYVDREYLAGYAAAAPALEALLTDLRPILQQRLPGPDITAEQLQARNWWSGPELFVLVDDYDLVAAPTGNPIAALLEFLPQAKDVGLHLIICRRTGGASRALFEPVVQRLRDLGAPGIVGAGSRDEGALLGTVKPSALPPGRGVLVGRRFGAQLIQLAKR
ncbi:S-DNA-T family DNA segregation ATPase FtsK/SpoIIIE [Jatrophihabitans sp. GAS493]|nr:S-DNA-T family DNA segregation ATPase FtsK/SpoIIIE [Jatrophihabitans sp. GAS493]